MIPDEARVRLQLAAASLGLDSAIAGVLLRVSTACPTAVWVYNQTRGGGIEIHVHPSLCMELPSDELAVLLLHEIYHHVGFGANIHLRGLPNHFAVNLALDIALERVIAAGAYGAVLARLNDRLMVKPLPAEGPLTKSESLPLLVHSAPPLGRMPPEFRLVWERLWLDERLPAPEECYRWVFPLADNAGALLHGVCTGGPLQLELDGGGYELLWPHEIPPGATPVPLPDKLLRRLSGLAHRSSAPGTDSWLTPALVPPAPPVGERAGKVRAWLGGQVARRLVDGCLWEVAGDLLPEARQLPYLLRPTRKELTRRAVGWPAIYHANQYLPPRRVLGAYIDVSGSMTDRLPEVVAVLRAAREALPLTLWAFDTEVRPVAQIDALEGRLFHGGGTCFDAVFMHALESRTLDFVVFTDGESEVTPEVQAATFKAGLRARAVLFGPTESQPWWWAAFHWPGIG